MLEGKMLRQSCRGTLKGTRLTCPLAPVTADWNGQETVPERCLASVG